MTIHGRLSQLEHRAAGLPRQQSPAGAAVAARLKVMPDDELIDLEQLVQRADRGEPLSDKERDKLSIFQRTEPHERKRTE